MGEFSKPLVVPTYPIDAFRGNCENVCMFLREKSRTKDKKTHRYWSVVENHRVSGGGVVQRQVLYLVELNNNQWSEWIPKIEEFLDGREELQILACDNIRAQPIRLHI